MPSGFGVGYRFVLNAAGGLGGGDGLSIACNTLSASADNGSLRKQCKHKIPIKSSENVVYHPALARPHPVVVYSENWTFQRLHHLHRLHSRAGQLDLYLLPLRYSLGQLEVEVADLTIVENAEVTRVRQVGKAVCCWPQNYVQVYLQGRNTNE